MFRNLVTILFALLGFASFGHTAQADELQDISSNINSTAAQIAEGKTIYLNNCQSCHGPEGKGDGPAAVAFNPKPRNFTVDTFKQGASPSAAFHTMTTGLGSMPSFASMSVADRMAVVHYVLSISPHIEKDTPESLAKIGLDPTGKPLAGFTGGPKEALPVEFIIERMATDGNIDSLNYKEISQKIEADKKAKELASAKAVFTPDLKRGKQLFTYCQVCHGDGGEGMYLSKAPQIAGKGETYLVNQLKKFQEGVRGANANDVNGLKMRPMSRMLQNEADIVNVAHYTAQLSPKTPQSTLKGDAEKGKMGYATCMACHGADAKGVKAMNAPSLADQHDWYVVEQIQKFKAGYRGADPKDVTGGTMRGMSMSLPDDQAVIDIMAYIQTLKQ